MSIQKYNIERLEDYCIENAVELIGNYTETKITSKSKIIGKCIHEYCNKNFNKIFYQLIASGPFCREHVIYNIKNLQQYCIENKIILIGDYTNIKITLNTKITGKCNKEGCNNAFCKKFRILLITGPLCKKHTINSIQNEQLQQYCIENNITLTEDYTNIKITQDTKIKGKCTYEGCDDIFCKRFEKLLLSKTPLCKKHASIVSHEKYEKTCIEKYGVKNLFQSEKIKNKIKETLMERYGAPHPSQSQIIREQVKERWLKKCGVEHPSQSKEVQDKAKQTNMNRYGVPCAMKLEKSKEKLKNTCIQKYGVPSTMQLQSIKDKAKQTCIDRYGFENPTKNQEIKDKTRQTCLNKYGVEYIFQVEKIREKIKQTCIERYGVESPLQHTAFMEKYHKSMFITKDYTLPSGAILKIQGFEHFALDELLNNGVNESDIITGILNIPEIWYEGEDQKFHKHYVDIFIPSQNKCIEVKSVYTFGLNQETIFLKQIYAKQLGYQYEIWVYNAKGERVETHT